MIGSIEEGIFDQLEADLRDELSWAGGEVSTGPARCRWVREDDSWTIEYAGSSEKFEHLHGFVYLAELLLHPGKPISTTVLRSLFWRHKLDPDDFPILKTIESGIEVWTGDRATLQDPAERKLLHEAIESEREKLECAIERQDVVEASRLDTELRKMQQYAESRVPSYRSPDSERTRRSVCKAIKRAINRLTRKHPALAEHLLTEVRTGHQCGYDPSYRPMWEIRT